VAELDEAGIPLAGGERAHAAGQHVPQLGSLSSLCGARTRPILVIARSSSTREREARGGPPHLADFSMKQLGSPPMPTAGSVEDRPWALLLIDQGENAMRGRSSTSAVDVIRRCRNSRSPRFFQDVGVVRAARGARGRRYDAPLQRIALL